MALLEPFIDTVIICTTTALVVIITGVLAALQGPGSAVPRTAWSLTSQAFAWWCGGSQGA